MSFFLFYFISILYCLFVCECELDMEIWNEHMNGLNIKWCLVHHCLFMLILVMIDGLLLNSLHCHNVTHTLPYPSPNLFCFLRHLIIFVSFSISYVFLMCLCYSWNILVSLCVYMVNLLSCWCWRYLIP